MREEFRKALRVMLIVDRESPRLTMNEAVEQALLAGVGAIQLRDKKASTKELYELAMQLRELTGKSESKTGGRGDAETRGKVEAREWELGQIKPLLIINDRVDVALAAGADGVHLGWQSMSVGDARRIAPSPQFLIGVSTHNFAEAENAAMAGADYITFGPVFPTPKKEGFVPVTGTEPLRVVKDRIGICTLAIGGIEAGNIAQVLAAGADGIAVIRAILDRDDPGRAAQELMKKLQDQK